MVSGRIDPNRYMAYYRQLGNNPGFLSMRIDVEGPAEAAAGPRNLISSTQIDMALTELFAPATAAADGDFDRLMVPFLCVASDMNSRGPVVMRRGDLSEGGPLVDVHSVGFQADEGRFDAALRRRYLRPSP